MKTIGIVAEGERDYDMIVSLVDLIMESEQRYLFIQPQADAANKFGNGWKGVWKWCDDNHGLNQSYFQDITPNLDLLIIHMDADVSRCEKEVHCDCAVIDCSEQHKVHPLNCQIVSHSNCPISLPCKEHPGGADGYISHLNQFILNKLGNPIGLPICIMVPCDSTDAWIVAAYDQCQNCENIADPWIHIVAKAPNYHNVRIRNRPNKAKITYQQLIQTVCENWDTVKSICHTAQNFEDCVKGYLSDK